MEAIKICWCGNTQLTKFSEAYSLCATCGTLVSQAGLTSEQARVRDDSTDFYGKEYWLSHQTQDYDLPNIYQRARQDLPERCFYWLETLLQYLLPPAKILELGCSHGGSVALMSWAGFDAIGLEISAWVVDFAQKTFNIPMLHGQIEEQQIEAESLDAILLFDVLEHLPDPLTTIQHCASLLKPTGLFVVQMPSYPEEKSYDDLVAQTDKFIQMMLPIEHLHLFSHRAAQQFFERLEFNYLEFQPALFAYDMFFVASRQPLVKQTQADIERSLLKSASGRMIQALIDRTQELQQLQSDYQNLIAQYQAAEFDRAERLKVIEKQGQDLANLQALIHQAQAGIAQYQTELELVSQQLKQTQNKAQQQQQQLADSQTKLAATKTKLRQARSRMNKQKADLQDLNTQLLVSRAETEAMQTSKFWRLRNQWMKVKKIFE